jgi:hypothetical protein
MIPVRSLIAAANIAALADTDGTLKCFQDVIPQDVAMPAVVWSVLSGTPESYLGEGPGMDSIVCQIDVYGDDPGAISIQSGIGRSVLSALENGGQNVCIRFNPSAFEEEDKRYRVSFDMRFWLSR